MDGIGGRICLCRNFGQGGGSCEGGRQLEFLGFRGILSVGCLFTVSHSEPFGWGVI